MRFEFNYDSPVLHGYRKEICDWLLSNNLNPNTVYDIKVRGGKIRAKQYLLNDNGQKYLIPGSNGVLATGQVIVPMKSSLPKKVVEYHRG